mgnify:FL=1
MEKKLEYSGSLTREQFLFYETRVVARLLADGLAREEILKAVNLSADLCNVISPLLDLGYLTIHDAHITYIERIRERSRYARQGVLFIQFQVQLHGI